jgi:hypothetical protein
MQEHQRRTPTPLSVTDMAAPFVLTIRVDMGSPLCHVQYPTVRRLMAAVVNGERIREK